MLGKRQLVDYSDEEDEDNHIQEDKKGVSNEAETKEEVVYSINPAEPKKKLISYQAIGKVSNSGKTAINSILNSLKDDKIDKNEILVENSKTLQKAPNRKIEFDTVNGKRTLELDRPRQKVWKTKVVSTAREPYYYKAMEEIYAKQIEEQRQAEEAKLNSAQTDQNELPAAQAETSELAENQAKKSSNIKEIRQSDLVDFNSAEYLATKQRRDLLVQDRLEALKGSALLGTKHKADAARAYELIEKEMREEGKMTLQEERSRRNRQQYGF